jgi:hypothetical protein
VGRVEVFGHATTPDDDAAVDGYPIIVGGFPPDLQPTRGAIQTGAEPAADDDGEETPISPEE